MQDEGVAKMNYMKSIAVVHFEHDSAPCSEYTGKQNLDEITFEAFKWHQQLQGNSDRYSATIPGIACQHRYQYW